MPKILLADDSTHAQRMGAKILSAEGFEVTTVGNGQAAVQSLKQSLPDLVVADIFMPGRNGYEVCQFIKKDTKLNHIPVLLIIGAMEPYDPEEGKRSGADGLITKPLENSNLVTTVRDLLTAAARKFPGRTKPKEEAEPAAEKAAPIIASSTPSSSPEWSASDNEEFITNAIPERMQIPVDVGQQPVGMFADFETASGPAESSAPIASDPAPTMPSAPIFESVLSNDTSTAQLLKRDALLEPSGANSTAMESAPPVESAMASAVWMAEPAVVTAEEEKLFDQPAGNWGDLTQMVEESGAGNAPLAETASHPPVATAVMESGDVISSPADRSSGRDPGREPPATVSVDNLEMLEELEVAEAGGTFAPASSHRGGSAESLRGSNSPFGAVVPMPVESAPPEITPPAPPEPAAVAPVEEAKPEPVAEAPAEPVSEAVAVVEASAEPDQGLVEQRVRERLEQLMPDIISQVKKSLQK